MFSYTNLLTPKNYKCEDCCKTGVRLYRYYQIPVYKQHLRCTNCALKSQSIESIDNIRNIHNIGSMVAAIPTQELNTYWGYCSVPSIGVEWWNNLPSI